MSEPGRIGRYREYCPPGDKHLADAERLSYVVLGLCIAAAPSPGQAAAAFSRAPRRGRRDAKTTGKAGQGQAASGAESWRGDFSLKGGCSQPGIAFPPGKKNQSVPHR